ncbi:MAG TPA: hypothetical protein PKY73_01265, partial [Hyphomonas sp.]|nr:hypothetical protein [Hyphomonas sp.]
MTRAAKLPSPEMTSLPPISAGGRRWKLVETDPRQVQSLLPVTGGIDLLARLRAARGIDPADAAGFL